ncbi:MAG: hypothetical protein L6R41_000306 [Letrouitia leprolyta]|nr:MAG: hypothetical protein L6R41_000306 [Letrouitia leprolyta]
MLHGSLQMHGITIVYLLFLISCQAHESDVADNITFRDHGDQTNSGNYIVNNCACINRSKELQIFLPQVWQALQLVLTDLEHGTASRHGFSTFFKSNTNRPIARQVYRAIADGKDLPTGRPIIECVCPDFSVDDEPLFRVFLYVCGPRPPSFQHHLASALVAHGTVVLCPAFWDFDTFPDVDDCVPVAGRRGRKRFLDSGRSLGDTRFSVLVHELIHLYNPLDRSANRTDEVYDIQQCAADLDKDESVSNAQNWAYYADGWMYEVPKLTSAGGA